MASSFTRLLLLLFFLHWDSALSSKIGEGYKLLSLEQTPDGGLLGLLQVKAPDSIYGPDIPTLKLFVKHETRERLRVHVTDSEHPRWEVPYSLLPRQQPPATTETLAATSTTSHVYAGDNLVFSFVPDPFGFAVSRKATGETLFNTTSDESDPFGEMVFKDQYLEISTRLPDSASLYGLGENTQRHGIKLFPGDPYTLYTTDISAISLNTDLYGSHPVYMDLRNGSAHAVLLLNSNGMDVFYRGNSLTYKVIGGVFDFFFFAGPEPLSVVDQYTQLIGRPAPMPYWAFGFHQCRWGYHNLSVVEDVVESYRKAEIPLDVIWNDDDHMDGHKDFTLNPVSYPREKLAAFLEKIHGIGMKYIVLIDPGIAVNSSYGVYQRGMESDVFIKYEGKPYLAQVWPGPVYFPDFLNPETSTWWADEIRRFHDMVAVDGLWIDMNEASNFCSGLCTIPTGKQCPSGTGPGWICCLDCKNITDTKWDDPPYRINASGSSVPIGYKTIATSAYHHDGVLEYDAHSIYGFSQAVATRKALLGLQGKRPFILSRSTFVGSGKYAAHWTGDNKATWQDLKYSISTILNFGMFGIPMVGADICGFYPKPTEELCNRWIELGAFYPFARDHANYYSPRQELYQWESVATSARSALGLRYKLLPYLYTLNYEAHSTGAPIARPLFFTFPDFVDCYSLSTQFLLGRTLMVSPVLEKGERHVTVLFPPGSWYSMFDMTKVVTSKKGRSVAIEAPLNVVNVHLYEGTVLPMQKGGLISRDVKTTPFTLVVSFPAGCSEGEAKGTLYVDEDDFPEMVGSYVEFHADVADGSVRVWSVVQNGGFALEKEMIIDAIVVLGLGAERAEDVEIDGMGLSNSTTFVVKISQQTNAVDVEDAVDKFLSSVVVEFTGLKILLGKEFVFSSRIGRG